MNQIHCCCHHKRKPKKVGFLVACEICARAVTTKKLKVTEEATLQDLKVNGQTTLENTKINQDLEVCGDINAEKNVNVKGKLTAKTGEFESGLVVCGEGLEGEVQELSLTGSFNEVTNGPNSDYEKNTNYHQLDIRDVGQVDVTVSFEGDGEIYATIIGPDYDASIPRDDFGVVQLAPEMFNILANDDSGSNPVNLSFNAYVTGIYSLRLYHYSGEAVDYQVSVSYQVTTKPLKVKGYLDLSEATIIDNDPVTGFWRSDGRLGSWVSFEVGKLPNGEYVIKDSYVHYNGTHWPNTPAMIDLYSGSGWINPGTLVERIENGFEIKARPVEDRFAWPNDIKERYIFTSDPDVAYRRADDTRLGVTVGEFINFPSRYVRDKNPKIIDARDSVDMNDPRFLFNAFADYPSYATNNHLTNQSMPDEIPGGWNSITEYREKIVNDGVKYNTNVTDVWPTISKKGDPMELPENPFQTYETTIAQNVDVSIFNNFGLPLMLVFENSAGYDLYSTVRVSGVTEASEDGVSNEYANGYWYIFDAVPGVYWFAFSLTAQTLWQKDIDIVVKNMKVECLSIKVTQPGYPWVGDGIFDTGSSPIITFEGATSVGGIPAEILNKGQVVSTYNDENVYWITLPPGTSRKDDIIPTSSEVGGGANVTVRLWEKPVEPGALAMYDTASPYAKYTPTTVIFTDEYNGAHYGAKVQIEGFTGEYSVLNGLQQIHDTNYTIQESKDKKASYLPTHYNFDSVRYPVPILFDSSDLPVYDSSIHGSATIKIVYGPVKPTTEYGELCGACAEFLNFLGTQTHAAANFKRDVIRSNTGFATWDSLKETTESGYFTNDIHASRDGDNSNNQAPLLAPGTGSFGLNDPFWICDLPEVAKNNPNTGDINQELRYDNSDPKYVYAVTRNNYLESVQNMIMTIDPSSGTVEDNRPGLDPARTHLSEFLTEFGYDNNGTVYDFQAVPYSSQTGGNSVVAINAPFAAVYGGNISDPPGPITFPVDAEFILADPIEASASLTSDCEGKIVVCKRGAVSFETKVLNAFNAGAVGCVVWNQTGDISRINMNVQSATQIPSIFINQRDGEELTGFLGGNTLDPANYTMPSSGASTGYSGQMREPGPGDILPLLGTDPNTFHFGKVREDLTPGKKIGYVRLGNTFYVDPLELMNNSYFTSDIGNRTFHNELRKLYARLMEVDIGGVLMKDTDGIIIDYRVNGGGGYNISQTFAEFFGDDRKGLDWLEPGRRDNGGSTRLRAQEIDDMWKPEGADNQLFFNQTQNLECSLLDTEFPGTRYTNGNVVLLWSTQGYSGGDMCTTPYRKGNVDPGNIGNGIRSYIIGNGDGRLYGGSSNLNPTPTNESTNLKILPSINGDHYVWPFSSGRGEVAYTFLHADGTGTLSNQYNKTAMEDGPLSGWVEDDTGYYKAVGLAASYPVSRSTGDFQVFFDVLGDPTTDREDQNKWHDPWMENAIVKSCE